MKRRLASLVNITASLLALLLLLLLPASCSKDQAVLAPNPVVSGSKSPPSATSTLAPSEGAVVLKSISLLSSFLSSNDLTLVTTLPNVPAAGGIQSRWYYLVRTNDGSPFASKTAFASFQSAVDWYSENSDVRLSEDDLLGPDRDGLTFDDVDNPKRSATEFLNQAAFAQIGLAEARTVSEGNASIKIALLDTGVDTSHPLFASPQAHFEYGGNYIVMPPTGGVLGDAVGNGQDDDDDDYNDDAEGHGTYVAGLIYSAARQATIRAYKVLNDEGIGTAFGLAKAIRAAATTSGVKVISLSLGTLENNEMLHHVIASATEAGIAVVASAGNKNTANALQYPAGWNEVTTVSAVDADDIKYSQANYGSDIEIVAPGVNIISAIPSAYLPYRYAETSGTSVAVAWISGAIATVMDARACSAGDAVHIIRAEADDIRAENPNLFECGRLNLAAAVNYQAIP